MLGRDLERRRNQLTASRDSRPRLQLERYMIICSCNILSDAQVRAVIASEAPRPRMSRVYASLGCTAQCGRCAHTIKVMLEKITRLVISGSPRSA